MEIKAAWHRFLGTTCQDTKKSITDDPVHSDSVIEEAFILACKTNSLLHWRDFSKVYRRINPTHKCILMRCCRGINANKCDDEEADK